ncbi:ChrR family anti-sigma-E factor [Shewanella gaetbuli]|uniref:ChrR family anti-sigma-E factor n=1 Tax=Shewanella gaetbuli TaxID=220752 RepID=A0A9X2CLW0_9GAMM|nr:ChrR family anti-sigma-E factor [Shewanella gaetbuli]MCL1143104.1 ChrR family anti-sigma-E factor [Shewanella gaetbuli]
MINYHPNEQLLALHIAGELPLSMSIAISAHAELCSICQQNLNQLNDAASDEAFQITNSTAEIDTDMSDMLEQLMSTTLDDLDNYHGRAEPDGVDHVTIKGDTFKIPRALRQQVNHPWQGIGKVSRLRLDTGEDKARASLLHIAANGEIPEHTHKGTELTLLLAGEFFDEFNSYQPGDFILLDENHQHSPKTIDGCLCYTIVDAPLYFTKGFSKLLNPIGELIY